MHEVVKMLETDVGSLQMPPKPFSPPHNKCQRCMANQSDPPTYYINSSYQFGRY